MKPLLLGVILALTSGCASFSKDKERKPADTNKANQVFGCVTKLLDKDVMALEASDVCSNIYRHRSMMRLKARQIRQSIR